MYKYIIDTHSHLDGEEFDEDRDEVVSRAKQAGVGKVLLPCINSKSFPKLMSVCDSYPDFFLPMIGLHPEDVKAEYKTDLDFLLKELKANLLTANASRRIIAIGEVGLDYYWDETYKREQTEAFEEQVKWALQYDLPLMIHVRNAFDDLIHILDKYDTDKPRGVFHCFSGTDEDLARLLKFKGFMFGIGGLLTFKKSELPSVLKNAMPLDRVLLETDAPYLAPVPHRGKRNESSFIVATAEKLACVYETSYEDIVDITTRNAKTLFSLDI